MFTPDLALTAFGIRLRERYRHIHPVGDQRRGSGNMPRYRRSGEAAFTRAHISCWAPAKGRPLSSGRDDRPSREPGRDPAAQHVEQHLDPLARREPQNHRSALGEGASRDRHRIARP